MPTRIIDSHTGGEPTRLVVSGGPALGSGPLADRRERFARDHDRWRRALVNEPRGSEVIVGALLCEPHDPSAEFGVIFFNNVGYLGMCGHGSIGIVECLRYLGRVDAGTYRLDTPVGIVEATLHADRSVSVANVASYRLARRQAINVPGVGMVHGDVAWGGNWFFLCDDHGLPVDSGHLPQLLALSRSIQDALAKQGIRGAGGAAIDHVELLAAPRDPAHDGRSFVLCPGGAYDRSPCGTGTSAKLACLAADGSLEPGETWRQESVVGSVFSAHYERVCGDALPPGAIRPVIRGRAHVTLDATLVIDTEDPFAWGMQA